MGVTVCIRMKLLLKSNSSRIVGLAQSAVKKQVANLPLVGVQQHRSEAFAALVYGVSVIDKDRRRTYSRQFDNLEICARVLCHVSAGAVLNFLLGYQRLPQFLPHRDPPPPRTSLMVNSSKSAPMVAFTIAATKPTPRWIPSRGSTQLPMKAPMMPTMRSPTSPNPVPRTICPASHPAMSPTSNMISRLSPDICILAVLSIH